MRNSKNIFNIIGAGLAGCEAADYISKKGYLVNLYEMKPYEYTCAHKNTSFSELICSNSLKSKSLNTASGLLKQEMKMLDSLIIKTAYENEIPAGTALAVDRDKFSKDITDKIMNNPNINVITKKVNDIKNFLSIENQYTIIAAGPLMTDDLASSILDITSQDGLFFYDAIAPTVLYEDIDLDNAYMASRYDSNDKSYINCPLTKEEYEVFYNFTVNAKTAQLKYFEEQKIFEGCMPFEVLAKRGYDSLRYGPMKPVGLTNPHTGSKDYAVIQLRQDNAEASIYNLVGFQTNLTFSMQDELLKLIPALKKCKIIRYGVMHRNTYLNSPVLLNKYYQMNSINNLFFAGQITGVEGYLPSASSGLTAAINCIRESENLKKVDFTPYTIIGALQKHISTKPLKNYLPMNANYGILTPIEQSTKNKSRKYEEYSKRSFQTLSQIISLYEI
ncbi:MAG: methylenetetrahydrofolate--tRNA-(uracil(54)-C(5))-methyltransferase (FADH(2)-oxidizing) TrmFO [Clostridia bacterium]